MHSKVAHLAKICDAVASKNRFLDALVYNYGERVYYIDGNYVKEEPKISILDLSILRGFSVFDYLRTYQGKPFHLRDHLERLHYSSHHIGLELPHSLEEISQIIDQLLGKSGLTEASIKMILTGGLSQDHFTPLRSNLIAFAYPLTHYPPSHFNEGIKVITTSLTRTFPSSKTTQYAPAIVAMKQAKTKNAQEALYLNAKNEILEATTSNFFAFKKDTLYTNCSSEVLAGITREVVLKLAQPHFKISFTPIPYHDIPTLDEAFLTASNKEVMPVCQIDTFPVGNGKVGPKTLHLMKLFRLYTQTPPWLPLCIPRYASLP